MTKFFLFKDVQAGGLLLRRNRPLRRRKSVKGKNEKVPAPHLGEKKWAERASKLLDDSLGETLRQRQKNIENFSQGFYLLEVSHWFPSPSAKRYRRCNNRRADSCNDSQIGNESLYSNSIDRETSFNFSLPGLSCRTERQRDRLESMKTVSFTREILFIFLENQKHRIGSSNTIRKFNRTTGAHVQSPGYLSCNSPYWSFCDAFMELHWDKWPIAPWMMFVEEASRTSTRESPPLIEAFKRWNNWIRCYQKFFMTPQILATDQRIRRY